MSTIGSTLKLRCYIILINSKQYQVKIMELGEDVITYNTSPNLTTKSGEEIT